MTLYFEVSSGTGSGTKNHSQVVSITAYAPLSGYVFDGWKYQYGCTIANASSSTTTATMSASTAVTQAGVTATYKVNTLYFAVYSGGGDGTKTYGSNVGIYADSPPGGKMFDVWTSITNCSVANAYASSTTATMGTSGSSASVTATYKDIPTIYLTVTGGTGDGTYDLNEVVNIVADSPDFGWVFYRWTSANNCTIASSYSSSTTATMGSSGEIASVASSYSRILYTVQFDTDGGGTISGFSSQNISYEGTGTEVVATPNNGYSFSHWSDSHPTANRTPTNVSANATFTAYFIVNDFTVNFYGDTAGGYLDGDTSQTIVNGGNGTTVTAIPYRGYYFWKWSDDTTNPSKTPTSVVANANYTAYFTVFGKINMRWYTH